MAVHAGYWTALPHLPAPAHTIVHPVILEVTTHCWSLPLNVSRGQDGQKGRVGEELMVRSMEERQSLTLEELRLGREWLGLGWVLS